MTTLSQAMELALLEASKFVGATAPNPPVGAVILDSEGLVLAVAAHERAGTAHAEAKALAICEHAGTTARAHTAVVTLEPCNHHGKTPPCADALLLAGIRRVVYGVRDPNPVAEGGAAKLRAAGVEIVEGVLGEECAELLLPFRTRLETGHPFVVVKTAHSRDDSMIPPTGTKTFTSPESLRLAHELRKSADAVLTGSGTILIDNPSFTVRHVEDFPGKIRFLAVMDRRRRVSTEWVAAAEKRGFRVVFPATLEAALRFLGEQGCLTVLVEAGPTISGEVLARGYWNRHYRIRQGAPGEADAVSILANDNFPTLV
jgi:diaminohydroxyphosphoribosylaminopyrimidine deaminase/5-amino-6-(5-phosphoribosylamino)uracil reductase